MVVLVGSIIDVLDAVDPNIMLTVSLGIVLVAGALLWRKFRR